MGVEIDEFEVPVCNAFQAKILNDQLCYEVDLNNFASKDNLEANLKLGFNFIMDYNEDRQVFYESIGRNKEKSLARSIVEFDKNHHAFIHLNTIGT